jgi:two-component system sensor histidine kinase QseC
LLPLPLLLLLLRAGVRSVLAPLRRIAEDLARRQCDDATPIALDAPLEVRPLLAALNGLFPRVAVTLERERRFTADAAHELRTPLAALQVQAEVAQLSDGPVREHAHAMLLQGIARATRLVEQLLSLSRLDPMAAPVHATRVDWNAVVAQALDAAAALASERRVRIECAWSAAPGEVLPVSGDETLLALLLRNLLDNAVRYGGADSTVTLRLGREQVEVLDRGPGIAPDWLGRVGERFVRPPGQVEPGSGLGLSIVARIAVLHGLHLALDNHPAAGLSARLVAAEAA